MFIPSGTVDELERDGYFDNHMLKEALDDDDDDGLEAIYDEDTLKELLLT